MSTEFYSGDIQAALADGKKPLLHRIVLTEPKELVDLGKLARFYVESLYFRNESSKVQPRARFTLEPRFSLGKAEFVHALAPLAKAKIKRHDIQQIVAPGYGGVCGLMCFLATGERFNWTILRIDEPKKNRILTVFDGYIDPEKPVWITDDLLASGHAAIKTIRLLRNRGYKVAGFIPVVADLSGNTGARAFQTIGVTMRFSFDYLVGLQKRSDEKSARLVAFDKRNKAIHD